MGKFLRAGLVLSILGIGFWMMSLRAHANVTISNFAAKWQSGKVVVEWKTGTEKDFVGYNIYRGESANGPFTKIRYESKPECMLQILGCQYSVVDSAVTAGKTYYYQLESVNVANQTQRHSTTAIAQSPAAPTATATATRTRTPTATATVLPQFTPTRTRTLPPGVTPPTATPTSPRVAIAQATPTTARAGATSPSARTGASNPPASPSIGVRTPGATQVALAPQEPSPEDSTEEIESEEEDSAAAQNAGDARGAWLVRGGIVLLGGLFGLGALGCAFLAFLLARRFSRPEE